MKRRALLPIAIVLIVVLAGCSLLEDPTREDRAVAELEETVETVERVETYRYSADISVRDGSERVDGSLAGVVDVGSETMNATVTVEDDSVETYLVGETLYQQCRSPWDGWATDEIDHDGPWWRATPLGTQLGMFESGDLYHEGTERLDGREAIVLVGSPPTDEIGAGANSGVLDFGGPGVDGATARLWIGEETDLPVRVEVELELSDGDGTATATMSSRFSAYDESVDLELPTEARTDQRMSCPGR